MKLDRKAAQDRWRIVLPRRNGSELLVLTKGPKECLPDLDIHSNQRIAEQLNEMFKQKWGLETISLFAPSIPHRSEFTSDSRYHVMELTRPNSAIPCGLRWVSVSSLSANSFEDSTDFVALSLVLKEYQEPKNGAPNRPFARPGWFRDLSAWTATVIGASNLQLTGRFQQLNASPTFSLIRFETNGPAVWFKAVGPPNDREFLITTRLAEIFPRRTSKVLAQMPEWNGWLALEATGVPLGDVQEFGLWERAAANLADLQIESIGLTDTLFDSGCRDLRSKTLLELVNPFFDVVAELMDQQMRIPPCTLSREELRSLGGTLKDALQCLVALEIPDTLGHSDFNPGNIIAAPHGCTFIDWAEAHVSHPFITFEYLISHLRKDFPSLMPYEDAIRSAYAERWQAASSAELVSETFLFSPLVAVFAYAVGGNIWRDPERPTNPQVPGYLRSLARRMKLEADSLQRKRLECLN
jgi:hypothetical protein